MRRFSTRIDFSLLAATLLVGACGDIDELDDKALDEREMQNEGSSIDGEIALAPDAEEAPGLEPEGDGCTILPSDPVFSLRIVTADSIYKQSDTLDAAIENYRPVAGHVVVSAHLFSQYGSYSFEDAGEIVVPAGGQATAKVPLAALALPKQEMDYSGNLTFMARLEFDDGSAENLDHTVEVFFHSDGSGWRIYDAETLANTYDHGALSATAKIQAADAIADGARFGPALTEDLVFDPATNDDGPSMPDSSEEEASLASIDDITDKPRASADTSLKCFQIFSTWTDASAAEDYWTVPLGGYRAARGMKYILYKDGSYYTQGYLNDGVGNSDDGCLDMASMPGGSTYSIKLYSRVYVRGNYVHVYDDATSAVGMYVWPDSFTKPSGKSTVSKIISPYDERFNVAHGIGYALYRTAGGLTGTTWYARTSASVGSKYTASTNTVYIDDSHDQKKFVVVHELGHGISDPGTTNKMLNANELGYDDDAPGKDGLCPAAWGDAHSLLSEEYIGGGLAEGFGHFYAAAVWNEGGEDVDCWFHYYKPEGGDSTPMVDCNSDNGTPGFELAYMSNNCGTSGSMVDHGLELDWLRALWHVHTAGPSHATVTEMLEWMDGAYTWAYTTAYDELDDEADDIGGTLNYDWDNAKVTHGLNH